MTTLIPITHSMRCCQARSEPVSPPSPTYQTAPWSRARATAEARIQRAAAFHSWTARAVPYLGGLPGGGPPAKRWATRVSAHPMVEWPRPTVKPM